MPTCCLQMLFDDCRVSGVKTRSPAFEVVVVVAASVVRGFSQFCVIAMKSGNAGFDISVAIYSVHLAISLRALGSLVGSSRNHLSNLGSILNWCLRFRCSFASLSDARRSLFGAGFISSYLRVPILLFSRSAPELRPPAVCQVPAMIVLTSERRLP